MRIRILVIVAVQVLVLALAIWIRPQRGTAPVGAPVLLPHGQAPRLRLPAPHLSPRPVPGEAAAAESLQGRKMADLIAGETKLSRGSVEAYLEQNGRSAASLLAAFRATEDASLLREAQERFGTDPAVNYVALFASPSAEQRRRILETLKAADPDNALANYLSAEAYFQAGLTDQAVEELRAASSKTQFQNYTEDFVRNLQAAYLAAGYSDLEAKAAANFSLPLPDLAALKRLGQDLADLAVLYRQAGDAASGQAALQIGLNLAHQVSQQPYLIQDLVGLTFEQQILGAFDATQPYDASGKSVQDRLLELAQRRQAIKDLQGPPDAAGRWGPPINVLQQLSEADLAAYFDRLHQAGEWSALQWARGRQLP